MMKQMKELQTLLTQQLHQPSPTEKPSSDDSEYVFIEEESDPENDSDDDCISNSCRKYISKRATDQNVDLLFTNLL